MFSQNVPEGSIVLIKIEIIGKDVGSGEAGPGFPRHHRNPDVLYDVPSA